MLGVGGSNLQHRENLIHLPKNKRQSERFFFLELNERKSGAGTES